MKKIAMVAACLGMLAATSMDAGDVMQTMRVKVLSTPEAQLRLSRELIGELASIRPDQEDERRAAVAKAAAHLQAVARRWPANAAAIAEATVLEGELFVFPTVRAYPSGEEVARRGLAAYGKSSTGALLYRILGLSLQGQNRPADAEQAFTSAERHPKLRELRVTEQLAIWQDSALFYERHRKNGREAAKRLRTAARIAGLSLSTRTSLTLQSLERIADVDKSQAKEDLKELERLLAELQLTTTSNPAELASRRSYEAAVVRFRKKLE